MDKMSWFCKRKMIWTIVLVGLLLTILMPIPRALIFENFIISSMDSKATEYVNKSLIRATGAFVLARSINAVVSVLQESEIQVEPGGVGVSIVLGQILDPINDMVERFSWVMLVSVTSLGIQKVLIEVGPWFSVNIVLFLSLLLLLADLWIGESVNVNLRRAGGTLLVLAILIRFAIPVMIFLNDQVYEKFLNKNYVESNFKIDKNISELKAIDLVDIDADQQVDAGDSMYTSAKSFVKRTISQGKNFFDVSSKIEHIKIISEGFFDKIINLIVVFVLNTIILPLVFLWCFLKLGRELIGKGFAQNAESFFRNKISKNNTQNEGN